MATTEEFDAAVERVLDVIAPHWPTPTDVRSAIFEWPREVPPTCEEVANLAREIVTAVLGPRP